MEKLVAAESESVDKVDLNVVLINGNNTTPTVTLDLCNHGYAKRLGGPDGFVVVLYDVKVFSHFRARACGKFVWFHI